MIEILEKIDKERFAESILIELSKLPFGSLPKSELEMIIFNSIIQSYGGYNEINKYSQFIQSGLKMSHSKFKNKLLQAQLRFDNTDCNAIEILKKIISETEISDLIFDSNYMSVYINNPLKADFLKTFIHTQNILNDTSLNNSILKIHSKGILQLLSKLVDNDKLKEIEKEIIKKFKLKSNASFSLIGNLYIDSIFKAEFSLDPLKSAKDLIDIIRKVKI